MEKYLPKKWFPSKTIASKNVRESFNNGLKVKASFSKNMELWIEFPKHMKYAVAHPRTKNFNIFGLFKLNWAEKINGKANSVNLLSINLKFAFSDKNTSEAK